MLGGFEGAFKRFWEGLGGGFGGVRGRSLIRGRRYSEPGRGWVEFGKQGNERTPRISKSNLGALVEGPALGYAIVLPGRKSVFRAEILPGRPISSPDELLHNGK